MPRRGALRETEGGGGGRHPLLDCAESAATHKIVSRLVSPGAGGNTGPGIQLAWRAAAAMLGHGLRARWDDERVNE